MNVTYVFVNITQQGVDVNIASTIRTLQLAPHDCALYLYKLPLLPLPLSPRSTSLLALYDSLCFDLLHTKAIELTCQTLYPTCTAATYLPVQLPSPPCKFKCFEVLQACSPFIHDYYEVLAKAPNILPSSCDVEDNGMERWPSAFAVYSITSSSPLSLPSSPSSLLHQESL